MNQIAFILGDQFLYWHALILAAAVACTILMFLSLELGQPENRRAAVLAVPLALVLSLVLSR